jgi:glycosyltransferase involved in cell wall biosynthesis
MNRLRELPAVSVVVIVKDGEAYLADALDSVFQSEVTPCEILVVDGGSRDRTVEIASGYRSVTVLPQASRGIANAYNEGIARARGELVAFLSHDDLWLPGKLDVQVDYMARHPHLLYTVAMVEHFLDGGSEPPPSFRRHLLDGPQPGVIMETLVARRRVFDLVGEFDPHYSVSEDTDWFARARDDGIPMALLPQVLLRKRVHSRNATLANSATNKFLLRAMRGSIARKRAALASGSDDR